MHVHTVRTKFTLGDRVRYNSQHQRRSGTGTIMDITFGLDNHLAYLIHEDSDGEFYPGIEEEAITLLIADEAFKRVMTDTFRENDALYRKLDD